MIRTMLLLMFATSTIAFAQKPVNEAAEKAAIQAVLDAHGVAWTKGDAKAAAAVLTEDADWISGDGSISVGRAAIQRDHEEAFNSFARGSRHTHPGTANIRFIRPDVAIVDGDSYTTGLHGENGRALPTSVSRYTAVFVKDNGSWKVAAFRSLPHVKAQTTLEQASH
jgi:uncharacterized protein (TIGR02246 family)